MLSSLPVQLANVFLIAYATDAGFSLFVDAFLHDGGDLLVRSVRNSIAYFVLLLALLLLPVLAVAARLPTFPLLVLSTSALWFSMGGAPVALLLNSADDLPLALSAIQAFFAVVVLVHCRAKNLGRGWLLRDDIDEADAFSLRHTLQFVIAGVILAIPATLAYSALSLVTWLEVQTERFVQVDLSGIQLSDRRYTRDDQEIRLVAMMHLGEDQAYEDLAASFVSVNTIVLEEGVSDESQTLERPISYEGIAESLGLRAQRGVGSYLEDTEPSAELEDWPVLRNADVDASQFSKVTIEYLALTADLWSTNDPLRAFMTIYQHALDNPGLATALLGDILDLRNEILLGEIGLALPEFQRIIVPWGALHMPAIERDLIEQGFELESETTRQIIGWNTIVAALI